ncbi:hypothetical protein VNO78_21189 [Psophocarpus tetragonolobus]|uniref:Alpha/beta hydrolase fold-3 domain-containing protein n=1 Tax=Psophocarpus tetragonolobus TaxID=3891 RepID=A0AAN9SG41_PSOTE
MAFPPHVVEECMGILKLFSDGTVFRSNIQFQEQPWHTQQDNLVEFRDYLYNKKFNLQLRVYKPKLDDNNNSEKLPVIIFLRGGGFCFGSRTWPHIDGCCARLARKLRTIVVTPDYRLAPEHRLPAALDDGVELLRWLQRQGHHHGREEWVSRGVDFDRVFVLGDSSGGNIAHHMAVQLGPGSKEMDPVRVRGYILLGPFFGGVVRTRSEVGPPEQMLSLELLDRFWRLSLPIGESRDHPLANPFGPNSPNLGHVKLDPILVIAGGNELLKDRAADYATRLKELGKNIEYVEFKGKEHGFLIHDSHSEAAEEVVQIIKRFMLENSN